MPNYDLGTAEGKIVIDSSGVDAGVNQANQSLGRLGKGGQETAGAMQSVGASMLGIGGAAIAGFAIAVNSAADFEAQLSGIEAVSQGTEEQMERVREKALQLGADTKFSAGEAAGAIEELSRRGIGLEEVLGGAADATVNLAAATGTTLENAATIAANAMNVFGLEAKDLGNVTDLIAGFDVVGSSVEDFGMALTQSGAVANLVGVDFDDLTTAIAAMSKAGINSSDAGTSLKTFFNNLQPTTEKQIGLAKELGILTEDGTNKFYDQTGALKPLAEVAGILHDSMAGLTQQQQQMALETLFGSDAIRAAAVIAGEGAEGFGALATQIGAVSAEEQAATRMDNLSGSIEQLKGSIETYLIQGGSPFLESVRDIVDMITQLVNFFGSLPAPIQKMIGMFVLFGGLLTATAGAGLLVTGTFIKFAGNLATIGKAIGGASKAFQLLNLTMLANPIFLIIVALVALGVALVVAYKKSEKFRKFVDDLWATIKDVWGKIVAFFEDLPAFFSKVWDEITGAFDTAAQAVEDAWQSVTEFFEQIGQTIADTFNHMVDVVQETFTNVINAVVDFFSELPGMIMDGMTEVLTAFVDFLKQLPERFAYFLGLVIGSYIKFQIQLWTKVVETGVQVITAVIDFLSQLPGLFIDWLTKAFNAFVDFATMVIERNIAFWTEWFQFAVNKLTEFAGWLPGFLAGLLQQFVSWGVQFIGWAVSTFTNFVRSAINAIVGLPGQVAGILGQIISSLPGIASSAASGAFNIGKSLVNGLISGVGDLVSLVWNMVNNAINGIGNLGTTAYNKMKSIGSSMWNGFKSGLGISSPSYIEVAAFKMRDNLDEVIKTLGSQVGDMQRLSTRMPGIAREEPLPSRALASALPRPGPSRAADASPVEVQFATLQVQGPLIGSIQTDTSEAEALKWSRRLADLTYTQLEAQGNRAARVNGALKANG